MRVGKVKGLTLVNARSFCVERFGEDGWQRVRDALSRDDADIVAGVVSVGWYDVGLYDRLHETIDRVLGAGDTQLMIEVGRHAAERDLTTVHRVFMAMASPEFLMKKYGDFWRRYQDTGTWTVRRETKNRVRGTLTGWASRSPATCVRLAAYIERLVQLSANGSVRVARTKCCSRGDIACEFLCEWD